jgi:uncharacterized membrane protein required for colicin V production
LSVVSIKFVKHKDFDSFLEPIFPGEQAICIRLRDLILKKIAEIKEKFAYGAPFYQRYSRICFFSLQSCLTAALNQVFHLDDRVNLPGLYARFQKISNQVDNHKFSPYLCIINLACNSLINNELVPIDILFLLSLAYGFWQGFHHGVISTLFNVGAYVFGIILAFKVTPTTTNLMEAMFHTSNPMMYIAAFAVNVLAVMFVMRMAAKSLEQLFRVAYLGIANQALGAVVMGMFYILICSIVVWFMVKAQFLNPETIQESKTYPLLEPLPIKAYETALRLKPFAEEAWGSSLTWMDRLQKYGDEKTKRPDQEGSKIYKPDNTTIEDDPNAGYTPPSKTQYPPEDSDGIEE